MTGNGVRSDHHEVAIVGAGFGGMGVAVELDRLGIHDYVIFEKAHAVGGTWRDNTYPGLEVDIPSYTYCYKHTPKPDWSRMYAPGHEVQDYAVECARHFGLLRHIRFGTRVTKIRWDEEQVVWRIVLDGGEEVTARYVVGASGYLVEPRLPDIEGADSFAGKLMHTGYWDHSYELRSKRVALIGTGATAIQVGPAIVDQLAQLKVFQRTAIWLSPKPNWVFSERTKQVMQRLPVVQKALRGVNWWATELFFSTAFVKHKRYPWMMKKIEEWLANYIRREVDDPDVAEKLIPTYSFFCKRPSLSNTFYKMFNRENVELVTAPISRICPTGIVTADGALHEVDVIVCATGYKVFERGTTPTYEVLGKNGVNLDEWWDRNRYQAFLGTTIAGFPNYFIIVGPYAAAGASYFDVLDSQVVHISRCLRAARKAGANYVEVRRDAQEKEFATIQRRARDTVLLNGSCATSNSYYFDRKGDTPGGPRPTSPLRHWIRARTFPLRSYVIEHRTSPVVAPAGVPQGDSHVVHAQDLAPVRLRNPEPGP